MANAISFCEPKIFYGLAYSTDAAKQVNEVFLGVYG